MLSVGEGARRDVEERIASWGLNRLTVWGGVRAFRGANTRVPITVDVVAAIRDDARYIDMLVPEMYSRFQVSWRNRNASIPVNGTLPDYGRLYSMTLRTGRWFTPAEDEHRRLVAVLGADAADDLDAGTSLVGEEIRIGKTTFVVVGILEPTGAVSNPRPDEAIFIPLSTAQFRLMGTDRINRLNIVATSEDKLVPLAEQIERTIRRSHRLPSASPNDFHIRNDRELADVRNETARTFSILLASIAAVSLVVGGIGIMNIMLVSVTERTREIGIRKAIGAKRGTILLQFLLEAIVLCALGGLIGIALGAGAAYTLANQANWNAVVTMESIILAVAFSLCVGVFFGLYPALRAARLDPIEALRYE